MSSRSLGSASSGGSSFISRSRSSRASSASQGSLSESGISDDTFVSGRSGTVYRPTEIEATSEVGDQYETVTGTSQMEKEAARMAARRKEQDAIANILRQHTVRTELAEELKAWKKQQQHTWALDELDDAESAAQRAKEERDEFKKALKGLKIRSDLHRFMGWVTRSKSFDQGIMACIILNTFVIAVEVSRTEESNATAGHFFEITDAIFLVVYTVEFLMKVYVEPLGYWLNNYNKFDFLVLAFSYLAFVQIGGANLTFIRVLRALRGLRALRSVSFIRPLRVLVNALIKTLGQITNLLVLLLLLMYVFAIMGFYFWGPENAGSETSLTEGEQQWSTLEDSMLTLWVLVTADGWTNVQTNLDDRGFKVARIYTVCFIFIGNFIFTNLFIGVIIQNLDEAQEEEALYQKAKRKALQTAKKGFLATILKHQFAKMQTAQQREEQAEEERKQAQIAPAEQYTQLVSQLGEKTRHDDMVPMTSLMCNLVWFRTFLTSLDMQENILYRVQQLHFDLANTFGNIVEIGISNEALHVPPGAAGGPARRGGNKDTT